MTAIVHPDTPQWHAWRDHISDRAELVQRMDMAAAAGKALQMPREWPNEEARQRAEAAASEPACPQRTLLAEGALCLGLCGVVEQHPYLIDARGALAKIGLRPSDTIVAITTRDHVPWLKETRWPWDDFARKAPALRQGQRATVEWMRDAETKVEVATAWGIIVGKPVLLREEDVVPFLQAHPLTKRRLVRWWASQHSATEEMAEAALKSMNPRELQNATLLADNEDARPWGGRHQVNYTPDAELWRIR